ncbi:MAG: hypothetical protein AB1762_20345 [Gemmatimonadota bacterium]
MSEPFEFEDGGRKYRCHLRVPAASNEDSWWWFEVSGDQQSYAVFRAAKGDTRASVRERVVTFYTHRLARLAEPPAPRHRGRPPGSGAQKPAPKLEATP